MVIEEKTSRASLDYLMYKSYTQHILAMQGYRHWKRKAEKQLSFTSSTFCASSTRKGEDTHSEVLHVSIHGELN